MQIILKKSLIALLCLNFVFTPILMDVKTVQAQSTTSSLISAGVGCVLPSLLGAIGGLVGSALSLKEVPVEYGKGTAKEGCSDAIAYAFAKLVLAKVTKATLNWINSGFAGSPTFVQNPGSFFKSIADEEIYSFTAKIAFDPEKFPFGRLTAKNIINSIQSQLDYNASVTSKRFLEDYDNPDRPYEQRFEAFADDFLYGGGWDGYLAVTQVTQANPFDSYIDSVNRSGSAINASIEYKNPVAQVSKEVEQASGFLSIKKCANPTYYTPPSEDTSFNLAQAQAQSQNDPADSDTQAAIRWLDDHTCLQWETQTPGTAIAEQMNISLTSSQRQLELSDELNESIAAVFDALISQLFKKGVKSLSGEEDGSTSNVTTLGGYGSNTGGSTISSGSSSGAAFDQWFNKNPTFSLKDAIAPEGEVRDPDCEIILNNDGYITNPEAITSYDCNRGLGVIQLAYAQVLRAQSQRMNEALRWINYADYCLPGPRADWYPGAREIVRKYTTWFKDDLPKNHGGTDPSAAEDWQAYNYGTFAMGAFYELTGYMFKPGFGTDLPHEGSLYSESLDQIFGTKTRNAPWGYKQYIDYKYFNPDPQFDQMPLSTPIIRQEYGKKSRYLDIVEQNAIEITEAETLFLRLKNIYEKILTAETSLGVDTPNFEKFMKTQIDSFSLLFGQIKTTESIEKVIAEYSLLDEIIDIFANPQTGLVKACLDETSVMPANFTRRPYAEPIASPYDFGRRGWTGGDPLAGTPPSGSFLPEVTVSSATSGTNIIHLDKVNGFSGSYSAAFRAWPVGTPVPQPGIGSWTADLVFGTSSGNQLYIDWADQENVGEEDEFIYYGTPIFYNDSNYSFTFHQYFPIIPSTRGSKFEDRIGSY